MTSMDHPLHALSSPCSSPGVFSSTSQSTLALARLFCVVICQEVVQASKATSSYLEVGLLSRSSNWHSSATASGKGDGVSRGGWEDLCWGWVLFSGCVAAVLGCPRCCSLLSSQFLLTFSPRSLLTFLFSLWFFLRSKAERKSLLFCQWQGVL